MKLGNVWLVGNDARAHAMAEAIKRSSQKVRLTAWMEKSNPGIKDLADKVIIGDGYDELIDHASFYGNTDLAIISPEKPLMIGVADDLRNFGVSTVGPGQKPAQIEGSKAWARGLMVKHHIPGMPIFGVFSNLDGLEQYLEANQPFVLKPDGLTGGKGVQVQGEHFNTVAEAMTICREILEKHGAVVVEEKLEGEEFSLQCFCDGTNVVATPPVQDHKRRLIGDQGLNTGGMGSYSCANQLLPFLTSADLEQATEIVRQTVKAIRKETGEPFQGFLYGGFMKTARGIMLIEFNARLGDPEAIDVLSRLETDFLDICRSIASPERYGGLDRIDIKFKPRATVVKYVVPVYYGMPRNLSTPIASDLIQIGDLGKAQLYYSSVNADAAGIHLTSSRAIAVLGTSADITEAERIAEQGARAVTGAVDHRPDIGRAALIAKRVLHMKQLRGE